MSVIEFRANGITTQASAEEEEEIRERESHYNRTEAEDFCFPVPSEGHDRNTRAILFTIHKTADLSQSKTDLRECRAESNTALCRNIPHETDSHPPRVHRHVFSA